MQNYIQKLVVLCKRKGQWIVGVVILGLSLAARLISYDVMTDDYIYFVKPWFDRLSSFPGLTAFAEPFSNYTPLYLYLLKFLTYIPVPSLYSVKTLSVVFDIVLAILVYFIVKKLRPDYLARHLFLAAALAFAVPTIIMNGSLWGQCDSLYASFVVASFYFLLIDKPFPAALMYGVAFAFKVQSIFFAPVLVGYFIARKYNLLNLLAIPLVYIASIVPAWLSGDSLMRLLTIYVDQSGEYNALVLSAPTFYSYFDKAPITPDMRNIIAVAGVMVSGIAAVAISALIIRARKYITHERLMFASLFSVLLLPYILPRMHERYFFLADIFAVIYSLVNPREWYVAVLVVLTSFFSYASYLSKPLPGLQFGVIDFRLLATVLFIALIGMGMKFIVLFMSRRATLSYT